MYKLLSFAHRFIEVIDLICENFLSFCSLLSNSPGHTPPSVKGYVSAVENDPETESKLIFGIIFSYFFPLPWEEE